MVVSNLQGLPCQNPSHRTLLIQFLSTLSAIGVASIMTVFFSISSFWHGVYGLHPYLALHAPDGFFSLPVSLFTWIAAIVLIAISLNRVQTEYQDRTVPLMGVCAAFIFAAQMINFPIPGGTSGHLLGGTLAGVLLGPWAGTLVMTVVFIVQSVLFQDGGLTVLGANIFNMGLVGTFGGYYLYKAIRAAIGFNHWKGMSVATGIAAWASVVAAAAICALQLALSGTVPLIVGTAAMLGWHILIGIGEALITLLAVSYVWRTRPDLFYDRPRRSPSMPRSLTLR
jgi:cobalt/nickel transport system permease protein